MCARRTPRNTSKYDNTVDPRLGRSRGLPALVAAAAILILGWQPALADAPVFCWSRTYSSLGAAEARGLAVDDGAVYVTGSTWPVGGGNIEVLLFKCSLAGDPVWDRTWPIQGLDVPGRHLAVAGDELHLAGGLDDAITQKYNVNGGLDTSKGSGTYNATAVTGWWTLFSGDGGYVGYDRACDLVLDEAGNLYVVGGSERAEDNTWAYLEKYDPNGVKQWHQHYGVSGAGMNAACPSLVLSGHHLYMVGAFCANGSSSQVVVTKHDTDGTCLWMCLWSHPTRNVCGADVAVSGSSIFVTGDIGQSSDPTGRDLLLLNLHDNGTSVSPVNSTIFDGGFGDDEGLGIDLVDGKIYVAGSTDVGGHNDALVLGYDTGLNHLWTVLWGGEGDDSATDIRYRKGLVYEGFLYVSGTTDDQAFVNAYLVPGLPYEPVHVDIKPGSCPNPLNRTSDGLMPVAIVGTEDLDVSTIDANTILLTRNGLDVGVAPVEVSIEDVATPFEGEPCGCHELGADGRLDLALKFDTQQLVQALDLCVLPPRSEVLLTVVGALVDDTPFAGSDCVWLVPKHKLHVNLDGPRDGDVAIDPVPDDPELPEYPLGTAVTLTGDPAPGRTFKQWRIFDPNHPGDANYAVIDSNHLITIVINADREVTASFRCGMGTEPILPVMLGVLGLFVLIRRRT